MVQRILQLKQENVNLFGWEIRDILKAEQAQAKSALKSGSNYCLKSKHLVMTSIPSVSSINRILRSSDGRPEPGDKQQLVASSNGFPSSNGGPTAAGSLHSTAILNPLAASHPTVMNHANHANHATQHGSLPTGSPLPNSPYSSQPNGRPKNLMNLNALNLLNSIKQQEQQSKLRADHKDAYLATIHHQLYHPAHQNSSLSGTPLGNGTSLQSLNRTSLNSSSLSSSSLSTPLNGSLSNASNQSHPSNASVQNLLQLSSSQLLVNQPADQSLDQLTANQAFQLATSYLNAKASSLMQHANQANHQLNTSMDHAAFILSQMHWQQLLGQSGGSMSNNLMNSNSASSNSVNSLNVNSASSNGKHPINSAVSSLINNPKHLPAVQEPLTLSSLMGNLNAPPGLAANPQLSSAMNNLLLTTKPNVFSQLLQQTSMDGQTFGSLVGQSTGDQSPGRHTKKYSSYNIADILMSEYSKQEIGQEIAAECRSEKRCDDRSDSRSDRPDARPAKASKQDAKQETADQIRAINERLSDQLKADRATSMAEQIKYEKDDEKDEVRVDILD